ncbi:MAG: zinc ribbon domain-containing protein [Dehalococcoidia bacterium]|nr:zinc ribbon domain-containing protein [Dehalococcoidia bacterium]
MPVYDYKCACRHTFECRQTFESEPFAKCPECGKMAHRQLHCAPIIFKGSGFYITDHRKEGGEEKLQRIKKDDKDSSNKSETTSEPKSDGKSESKPKSEGKSEPASGKPEKVSSKKD